MSRLRKLLEANGGDDVIFDGSSDGKPLLEDFCWFEVKPGDLLEEKDAKGENHFFLDGRFGLVESATANRRLYPRKLMERELSKLREDMGKKGVYGELDHPSDGKTKFRRVSHWVLGAKINENNEIIGRIELIPGTSGGDQAIAIAKRGGRIGLSSRGFGTVVPDTKGNHVVQEDYKLVTWDIVADPANAGAHPNFVIEDKEGLMKPEEIKKYIKENPGIVDALKNQLRDEVESEAREHARDSLKSEFERQLKEEADGIRQEAVEQATEQALSDPEVAGAKRVVESLKELVAPYLFEGDENKEITKLRGKIQALEEKLKKRDETISEQIEELDEVSGVAREFGYHLYLLREHQDEAKAILGRIGDINRFGKIEEFKSAVEEVLSSMEEENKERTEREEELAKKDAEIEQLKEQRDQAVKLTAKSLLRAYMEKKISGHPKAGELREHIETSVPKKKEDVDKLIVSFDRRNPVSEEFKRIRRGLKRNRSESVITQNEGGVQSLMEEDDTVMGVSMDLLKAESEKM